MLERIRFSVVALHKLDCKYSLLDWTIQVSSVPPVGIMWQQDRSCRLLQGISPLLLLTWAGSFTSVTVLDLLTT